MKKALSIFFFLLIITACSTSPDKTKEDSKPVNPINRISHPAVIDLWNKSEKARKDQNLKLAESYIEQALKIKPKKAILWSRLAELALKQQQATRAENFAARSNAYADNDLKLLRRNWLIIQYSREKRNDLIGAKQAELTIQKLGL